MDFKDVFAWSYDDMKAYKDDVIQHTIPLVEGAKPFRQKLRQINTKLIIKQELEKMLSVRIISPSRHTTWLSNLVIMTKKLGQIHLCVDFKNLNVAFIKDNYPLPNMEML